MKQIPWPLLKNQRWSTCDVFGPVIEGVLEAPASKDLFEGAGFFTLGRGNPRETAAYQALDSRPGLHP